MSINQPAPDFSLPSLDGNTNTLSEQRGCIVILNFWSAECPIVERVDKLLFLLQRNWGNQVVLWLIACNVNESREMLQQEALKRGFPNVLIDKYQQVSDLFDVQTTPYFVIIDEKGILRYQGAFDDINFKQKQPTYYYVQWAVESMLVGQLPVIQETMPFGCSIVRFTL